MAIVDTHWQYRGLKVVRLENDLVCLDIFPECGAKIYNFIHKPSGRNLLWHNPHVPPARQAYGAAFDNHWSGGWDELIPNDPPTLSPTHELLPDHGEIWSQTSEISLLSSEGTEIGVRFENYGRVTPLRFEKTVRLREGEPFARIQYALTNTGSGRLPFNWNIHPAIAISPTTRLDLPAGLCQTDSWREEVFPGSARFTWPFAVDRQGRKVDLRRVSPPDSDTADMHYCLNLREGWYAVTDQASQVGFALSFPTEVFPHTWLFRTYGGWRGLYTMIFEASTGYPTNLDDAIQAGTCAWLEPGATLAAEIKAIAYTGVRSVRQITPSGAVLPGDE